MTTAYCLGGRHLHGGQWQCCGGENAIHAIRARAEECGAKHRIPKLLCNLRSPYGAELMAAHVDCTLRDILKGSALRTHGIGPAKFELASRRVGDDNLPRFPFSPATWPPGHIYIYIYIWAHQ